MTTDPRPRGRRVAVVAAAASLPWTWLLLRRWVPGADYVDLVAPWLAFEAAVVAAFTLLLRWRMAAVALVGVALVATTVTVLPRLPTTSSGVGPLSVRVLTQNLTDEAASVEGLVAAVVREAPDVVVLTESNAAARAALAGRFPFQRGISAAAPPAGAGPYLVPEVDVVSRFPLDGVSPDWLPGVRVEATLPTGQRFVVFALHLAKVRVATDHAYSLPPARRRELLDRLVDTMGGEQLPVVVAGDLNVWDRSSEYRRLTSVFADAARIQVPPSTTRRGLLRWLMIRGDHVLMPSWWCADRFRSFTIDGADHRGIVVSVGPCARIATS